MLIHCEGVRLRYLNAVSELVVMTSFESRKQNYIFESLGIYEISVRQRLNGMKSTNQLQRRIAMTPIC